MQMARILAPRKVDGGLRQKGQGARDRRGIHGAGEVEAEALVRGNAHADARRKDRGGGCAEGGGGCLARGLASPQNDESESRRGGRDAGERSQARSGRGVV